MDGCTEGGCSKLSELEALFTEGDANDSNAPDKTEKCITENKEESTKYEPNNISNRMRGEIGANIFAEGPKRELSELKALLAEGNANDGDAEQNAQESPGKPQPQATKDEPNDVCDEFHDIPPEYGGPRCGHFVTE